MIAPRCRHARFACVAASAAGVAALAIASPARAQIHLNRGVAIDPDGYVRVHNPSGSVRVIGWERDSVAVTGTLDPAARFFMGGDGRGVKLGVELPAGGESGGSSYVEVRIPTRSQVWVKTAGADIDVSGVSGGVDLYSVTGRIRVSGQLRELFAESMAGAVEIDGSARSLRAKTASGGIALRGEGDDATLTSVGGTIVVDGGAFRRGRFESVTGDILFTGALDRSGAFEFQSHSGTVDLRFPAGLDADVTASSLRGEIINELSRVSAEPVGAAGRRLAFTAGRGGAELVVRSFSGPVRLRR